MCIRDSLSPKRRFSRAPRACNSKVRGAAFAAHSTLSPDMRTRCPSTGNPRSANSLTVSASCRTTPVLSRMPTPASCTFLTSSERIASPISEGRGSPTATPSPADRPRPRPPARCPRRGSVSRCSRCRVSEGGPARAGPPSDTRHREHRETDPRRGHLAGGRGRGRSAGDGVAVGDPRPSEMGEAMRSEDVRKVHEAGVGILERTGVVLQDADTVRLFADRGFPVDGQRVRISGERVEWAAKAAPRTFELHARGARENLRFGERMVVSGTGGAPFILEGSTLRVGTLADLMAIAKVMHLSSNVDMLGFAVDPQDVPVEKRARRTLHALLTLSDKPPTLLGFAPDLADAAMTTAEIIWGARWHERPCLLAVLNLSLI